MTSDLCKASYNPTASVNVDVLVPPPHDGNVHEGSFTSLAATIDLPQALFLCEVEDCGLALYSLEDTDKHKELHGTFPCEFCKLQFTYAPKLAMHELQHSKQNIKRNRRKIICPRCDLECERFKSYPHHHLKTHLSLTLNQPVCPICKTNALHLGNKGKLLDHFKTFHDVGCLSGPEEKFECTANNCSAYYLKPNQLHHHLKRHHNISTERVHKCKDCDGTFSHLNSLRDHRLANHVRKEKLIRCPFKRCNRPFQLKEELDQHMERYSTQHKNIEKRCSMKCPHCNRLFEDMKTILLHLKDSSSCGKTYDPTATVKVLIYVTPNNERDIAKLKDNVSPVATIELPLEIYTCKKCRLVTYTKNDEEAHEKLHGLFQCNFCDFKNSYAPNVSLHELEHCEEKRKRDKNGKFVTYNCSRCDFEKSTNSGESRYVRHHLKEHFSLNHVQPDCAICSKETQTEKLILCEHYMTFHDISKVKNPKDLKRCTEPRCNAYFLTNVQLTHHLKRRHDKTKAKNHSCDDCHKSYGRATDLRKHRQKCHVDGDNATSCCVENCAKKFQSIDDLIMHLIFSRSHKPDANAKDVQCPACETVVSGTDPQILKQHLKSQHATKHVCEQCGKILKDKHRLELHYLTHFGPASWEFMCSVCAKKCMTKQKLEEHMRTHTQEKLFACEVCGLKYAQRHNLRTHLENKHQIKEIPKKYNKTNLTSRKGIKRKLEQID